MRTPIGIATELRDIRTSISEGLTRLSTLETELLEGDATWPAPVMRPTTPPVPAPPTGGPQTTARPAPAPTPDEAVPTGQVPTGASTFDPPPPSLPVPPTTFPASPPLAPRRPHPQLATVTPWWRREKTVAAVLAVSGAVITLVGAAMLVVLAAQAGWFGPVARVSSAFVLATVLVGAGFAVRRRTERAGASPVGAFALVATGAITAYLATAAATLLYVWIDVPVGLVFGIVYAAGGIAVARAWESEALATALATVAALFVLGVGVDHPSSRAVFALTLLVIALLATANTGWGGPRGATGLIVCATSVTAPASIAWVQPVTAVVPVLLLVAAAFVERRRVRAEFEVPFLVVATLTALVAVAAGTTRVPGLADLSLPHADLGLAVAVIVFAALVTRSFRGLAVDAEVAAAPGDTAPSGIIPSPVRLLFNRRPAQLVAALSASLVALVWIASAVHNPVLEFLVATIAVVALVPAVRTLITKIVATAWTTVGVFALLPQIGAVISPDAATRIGSWHLFAMLLATAIAALWLPALRTRLHGPAGDPALRRTHTASALIAGGLTASALVIATATALGAPEHAATGFFTGHAIATIAWMVVAALLLLELLPLRGETALVAGLTLAAAAIAKLTLYDLAALSGLVRVAAFLGCGLVLLAVASVRHRPGRGDRRDGDAGARPQQSEAVR